jgi:hypothetical protein
MPRIENPGIMTRKNIALASFLCFAVPVLVNGVQLENWRFPYYDLASRLGYFSSSQSSMFWDDLGALDSGRALLDPRLWPDSVRYRANHWNLEPAVSYTVQNTNSLYGKNSAFHLAGLNDIRYGHFLIRQVLDVDSRYFDDPDFPWMKQRFAAGRIAEAYLQYDFRHGFARLGRLNRNWGPFADRSLLLSNAAYSYDAFEFGLHSSLFEFRHLFAALPQTGTSLDANRNNLSRYLTAHSLNLMLGRFGAVGITETVLFGRDKGVFDFQYINPVSIYSVVNTNGEGNGNLMLGFQWNIHPFIDNVALKGQVILDDFQVDNAAPTDQEPTHWGGDFGVFWSDFLPLSLPHVLSCEYRYCSSWLYTVADGNTDNGERYTYLGKSLGYPGNDGDSLNLSLAIAGKNFWTASVGFSFSRQGENRVTSRWHDSDSGRTPGALGYKIENPFPRGIVERNAGITAEVRGYFRNRAYASLALCNRWIGNEGNIKSPLVYKPAISLSLHAQFSNFFVSLPK